MDSKEVKPRFDVLYTEEARGFIESLPPKAQEKIARNISRSRYFIDRTLFKKLAGTEIWEFRTLFAGICYRLLAFWDTDADALVIATNGFIKKSQKTPQKEISRAETIRKEYFNDKRQLS